MLEKLLPIIDSRKVIYPSKSIFFAITGERHNGHDYIDDLYKKGVRNFVIEDDTFDTSLYDARFILSTSTIHELQKYARQKRLQFQLPTIGITGSNGKTIVKEWLSELLFEDEIVVKSPRSYNSQVGVPLSVWQIESYHTLGIFEAGISQKGEMEKLEAVIEPTIGIFTNIGSAHDDGFDSLEQKIVEKLKLFKNTEKVIYHKEDDLLNEVIVEKELNTLSWSFYTEADVNFKYTHYELILNSEKMGVQDEKLKIRFSDKAYIENLCHCIVFLLFKRYSLKEIQKKIYDLNVIPMRLEVKKGINNCQLIDDTYNNDLGGLQTALDFLNQQSQKTKKTVILSDILQTGLTNKQLCNEVSRLIDANNIERFVGIGEISNYKYLFNCECSFYLSTEDFLSSDEVFANESILIKGARSFCFEKIVKKMSAQQHSTVLEINLNALEYNYNYYKSLLLPTTKVMVMVKAHAYGSGSDEIAKILQYNGVNYLAVAYADEGVELRKKGVTVPIMVMNSTERDFPNLLKFKLEPEIYSFKLMYEWISFIDGLDNTSKIHLKIDTGMHRLGFEKEDVSELAKLIRKYAISIASVFTHLAGADDKAHNDFTEKQIDEYKEVCGLLEEDTGQVFIKHALNSSGIISFPNHQMDMVRLGIGLYGFDPAKHDNNIQTVSSLYSTISQIKNINKGDTIGYGRVGKAEQNLKVATINIGYADGISRQFSDGVGYLMVSGKKAPVIGNVCMDMLMVNVTNINCKEGDRVELFGNAISIQTLAELTNTIPYEILSSVSQRVKRVYFRD